MYTTEETYRIFDDLVKNAPRSALDFKIREFKRRRLENPGREKRKSIPRALKAKLYVRQAGRCAECHDPFDIGGLEADHIDCNRQDFNHPGNIQLLCRPCNREKGASSLLEQSKRYGRPITSIIHSESSE